MNLSGRRMNVQALADFGELSQKTRKHLVKVYSLLGGTTLSAFVGAGVGMYLEVGGLLTMILGFGALFWLWSIPHTRETEKKRCGILLGFGLIEGVSLSPLLRMVIEVDSWIVVGALLATTTIFVCFSLCALLAEKRSWLFLGGFLSSAVGMMAIMNLANIFVRSSVVFDINVYLGLLIFCGFVIFDTQVIIEKSKVSEDYVSHSLELFLDLVNIFVRLLIILSKNNKKKGGNSRSR